MDGLKSFLFFNQLSQQEVANYLGISKGYMSKLVSGSSKLRPEHLVKLLNNERGWNTEYLTDIEWKALEAGKTISEYGSAPANNDVRSGIPLIPTEAFAGPGLPTYNDLRIDDYYMISEFKNSDFLIRIKGDSMSPKFTGGDLVACKKIEMTSSTFFQWGRVYVIYTKSQGVMIKRVQPSEKPDCVKCVSDNEKYAPFDVPTDDIVALALVNGSISLE